MMTAVLESDYLRDYLSALTMRSDWFFLVPVTFSQSANKDQQEMRTVAEKPHGAVVKFNTYDEH